MESKKKLIDTQDAVRLLRGSVLLVEKSGVFEYDPTEPTARVNYCPDCGAKMDLGE